MPRELPAKIRTALRPAKSITQVVHACGISPLGKLRYALSYQLTVIETVTGLVLLCVMPFASLAVTVTV